MSLIKMTIPRGQCGHFSQVGPFEMSCFLIMLIKIDHNFCQYDMIIVYFV